MASYTPNLDLLKKSPVTDGDDMFNVETMLNENWDRIDRGVGDYTTPAQKMGLTGDFSVGASLGVLANIGNVHVWRKTVVTEEEIPAGYKLGATITKATIFRGATSSYYFAAKAHATISVLDDGTPVVSGSNSGGQMGTISSVIADDGEFIYLEEISSSNGGNNLLIKPWLVKSVGGRSSLQFDVNTGNIECTGSFAQVTTYPTTPPGTHVTYLTSTNRNAYQEGDDAKEAGYVLGDMVSGYLFASAWTGNASNYYYSETIKVSDTGTLTQENVKSYTANATNDSWVSNIQSAIRGKFITVSGEKDNGGSEGTNLVYIPDDAIVSYFENGVSLGYPYNYGFLVNKMQQVTGYPAIPAGTTIDYLGVLGEKVSVETGSYTGTGTYGSSNLNTIHLSRTPKLVFITPYNGANRMMLFVFGGNSSFSGYSGSASLSYQQIVSDGTDFSWYANNADIQLNNSGTKYVYTAVI